MQVFTEVMGEAGPYLIYVLVLYLCSKVAEWRDERKAWDDYVNRRLAYSRRRMRNL